MSGNIKKYIFLSLILALAGALAPAGIFANTGSPSRIPQHLFFINGFDQDGDFLDPMGLSFDSQTGEIYLADTGHGRICVFSSDGFPLHEYRSFQADKTEVSFVTPLDVAVNSQGIIFISDIFLNKVIAMNIRGVMEYEVDLGQAEPGGLSVGRIAIDSEDNLFIADGTHSQVLVYSPSGKFKYKFGSKSADGGTGIDKVNDIFPDRKASLIYVTSLTGPAIIVFDYDGMQIRSFGIHDSGEPNFSMPSGVTVLPDGTMFVADTLRSDVKLYTKEGAFIGRFGGVGYSLGAIVFPADLAASPDGRIFVLEKTMARIHVFKTQDAEGPQ